MFGGGEDEDHRDGTFISHLIKGVYFHWLISVDVSPGPSDLRWCGARFHLGSYYFSPPFIFHFKSKSLYVVHT